MASGKTLDLRDFARSMRWRRHPERPARVRDRSLAGKARRTARRQARHTA